MLEIPYYNKTIKIETRDNVTHDLDTDFENTEEKLSATLGLADDEQILKSKGANILVRIYLLSIKHKCNILKRSRIEGKALYYGDEKILGIRNGFLFEIVTLTVVNGEVIIEGISRFDALNRLYSILAQTNTGEIYDVEFFDYPRADILDYRGTPFITGKRFKVQFPIKKNLRVYFNIAIDDNIIRLKPSFTNISELKSADQYSYYETDGYLVRYNKDRITIRKCGSRQLLKAELEFAKRNSREIGLCKEIGRLINVLGLIIFRLLPLRKQIAFISIRSNKNLLGNAREIYDNCKLPKRKLTNMRIGSDAKADRKAKKLIARSKVVVTDDYIDLFDRIDKKNGQYYVQLWHATGAGKCFGRDAVGKFPSIDSRIHRNYDLVTVSSEGVRKVYAGAFGIPVERVVATGVARTDAYFNKSRIDSAIVRAISLHPEFENKQIIIYAPTFRIIKGISKSRFIPEINFDRLSEAIDGNTILAICPHPAMSEPILTKQYNNIVEVRDVSTMDMMFISDCMITDYSAIMFEYALLGKPMGFYCYDYDTYDRDFYMDFKNEIPGPLLISEDDLIKFIEFPPAIDEQKYKDFTKRYLDACDGHSTTRIINILEAMINDEERESGNRQGGFLQNL